MCVFSYHEQNKKGTYCPSRHTKTFGSGTNNKENHTVPSPLADFFDQLVSSSYYQSIR